MSSNTHNKNAVILSAALVAVMTIVLASGGTYAATRYMVRDGDSMFLIAQKFGVSLDALRAANGMRGDMIYVDEILSIPTSTSGDGTAMKSYSVTTGDSLFLIASRFGVSVDALRAANGMRGDMIYPGQSLTIPGTNGQPKPPTPTPNPTPAPAPGGGGIGKFSDADIYILAQLVTAEAGGESYEGQVAVAASVLNRVRSAEYPNTIPGVVYQVVDGRYYQYSPVEDGRINNVPSASAMRAVRDAISGYDPSGGALGFYNPAKTTNYWVRSRPQTRVIGGHVFFR